MRLVGNKKQSVETFPVKQIKRVRIVRRADGYYVQFGVQAVRKVEHRPSDKAVGIDLGLTHFAVLSDGRVLATDPANSKVLTFRTDGSLAGSYDVPKSSDSEGTVKPIGITVDGSSVYVSDSAAGAVRKIPAAEIAK